MSFNYLLAKEMYNAPWCVDSQSFSVLSSILKDIRGGMVLGNGVDKLNSISIYDFKSETRIVGRPYDLRNSDSFSGIGVINLDGPITKNGGESSNGTEQMARMMVKMSQDSRIKGFIIKADSGGGSSVAIQVMVDSIIEVKKTMPVYAFIDKGCSAASACYGIISVCTGIYAADGMGRVGSVGTLIQINAAPHGAVDSDGKKNIVVYASKSSKKNIEFTEAINNDNYDLIINELLDPVNENFINNVLTNRPQLNGAEFDDGHTVFTKDAVGTFIDGIASFDEVVNMILLDKKISNNTNTNTMTKEEFKAANPIGYAEIVSKAIDFQKEIVAGWAVFSKVNPEAVLKGIKSGLPIKDSEKSEFLLEATKANTVEGLILDSAKSVVTSQTQTSEIVESASQIKTNELINEIKLR